METAAKHFAGQSDLVLCASIPQARRKLNGVSRGGALFPHLYGDLDLAAVSAVDPLPLARMNSQFRRSAIEHA